MLKTLVRGQLWLQSVRPCTNHVQLTKRFESKHSGSSCEPLENASVFGSNMKYVDTGEKSNKLVVFLHGNPTSSYLWRNVIPHVRDIARCLAPDLIGMGKSDKVPGLMYTFSDHYKYLSEWMKMMVGDGKVNLVVHDWGSGLGFHWANEHRGQVESIVHMESLVCPLNWEEFPEGGRKIFQAMRSPGGEDMVLKKNVFVERILPSSILRKLTEEEMNTYREPFANPGEDRRPTLTWPRQIPINGEGPEDVVELAKNYYSWLTTSENLPKLFISAEPGFFSSWIEEKTKNWPNHSKITVPGIHFLQEDSSKDIGRAVHAFLKDKVFTI